MSIKVNFNVLYLMYLRLHIVSKTTPCQFVFFWGGEVKNDFFFVGGGGVGDAKERVLASPLV